MNPVPAVPTLSRTALVERCPVPRLLPPRRGGDRGQDSTNRSDSLREGPTLSATFVAIYRGGVVVDACDFCGEGGELRDLRGLAILCRVCFEEGAPAAEQWARWNLTVAGPDVSTPVRSRDLHRRGPR